jgi:hypothetical protein
VEVGQREVGVARGATAERILRAERAQCLQSAGRRQSRDRAGAGACSHPAANRKFRRAPLWKTPRPGC